MSIAFALCGFACAFETARGGSPAFRCEVDRSCPAGLTCDSHGFCVAATDAGTSASDLVQSCGAPGTEGRRCDDGNACTRNDVCLGSRCVGLDAVMCTTTDRCQTASCEPSTGQCVTTTRPDGLTRVATINTGIAPAGLAVDERGGRIYVGIRGADHVAVIDAATDRILTTVPTLSDPRVVTLNPRTHELYVLDGASAMPGLTVLDGAPNSPLRDSVVARVETPGRDFLGLEGFAIDATHNRIYLPSFDPGGRVLVIDGDTHTLVASLRVASNPLATVLDPRARRVLVGHGSFFSRTRLSALDVATNVVSDDLEVGLSADVLAWDDRTQRLWVRKGVPSRNDRHAILAFDGRTGRLIAQLGRESSGHLAIHPRTSRLYTVDQQTTTLTALDVATWNGTAVKTVARGTVANGTKRVAVNGVTGRVYVSQELENSIAVFDDLNTHTDPANCGACGRTCAADEECRAGQCVAPGSWRVMSNEGAPPPVFEPENGSLAAWTGTELLVWGGDGFRIEQLRNTGGRYSPALDRWRPMSVEGAPSARRSHTAVWTGQELVVWGGSPSTQAGGRYDPTADRWRPMSQVGAPSPRSVHSAIWTGTRMIVWGGRAAGDGVAIGAGGAYDPGADAWTPISVRDAPSARIRHVAVWTGAEMIVWGGHAGDQCPLRSGGRYDPVTETWRPMSRENAPGGWTDSAAAWTGRELFVWGGSSCGFSGPQSEGGLYDPALDRWRKVSGIGAPSRRTNPGLVWTGERILVWGGVETGPLGDGASYDPATDSWSPLPPIPALAARGGLAATVWTGTQLLLWGGLGEGRVVYGDGARYTPP